MNEPQLAARFAPAITFFAGLLAGKGVFGFDAATWTMLLGAAVGLAVAIYSAIASRKAALATAVANFPEVDKIKLDPNAPGARALNAATPANVRLAA